MINMSHINLVAQDCGFFVSKVPSFPPSCPVVVITLCLCPAASSAALSCESLRVSVVGVPFFCVSHAKGNGCHFSPSKDREIDDG